MPRKKKKRKQRPVDSSSLQSAQKVVHKPKRRRLSSSSSGGVLIHYFRSCQKLMSAYNCVYSTELFTSHLSRLHTHTDIRACQEESLSEHLFVYRIAGNIGDH